MMTDQGNVDDDKVTTCRELDHARVPCFHAHCRCDIKLPDPDEHRVPHPRRHHERRHDHPHVIHSQSRQYDHDDDDGPHHNHHHIHHHHHHHHNELHSSSLSSSSSSRMATATATSFQVGSLHRLLTLFVFLLAWAAVCGAPRRTTDGSLSRYNSDTEHTNSLYFDRDSSHPMAAISSMETLVQPSRKSFEGENAQDSSVSAAAAASPSTSLKTGSEPTTRVNGNDFPSPLDSAKMPGIFPGYMSGRVAFSVERPQTPPWPGDVSFTPDVFHEEPDNANTTDESDAAHSRRRRSTSISDLEEVCQSTSGWVIKKWGTDMYGQNVTILSEIMTAGNIQVTQWFYETACARPHGVQACKGIDRSNYDSSCLTKSAWVYAMIRTARGEEGWTWIAISSSCNCAVRQLSILEQFERRSSRLARLEDIR